MKMNREEFERVALEKGYENGIELFEEFGFNADDYENFTDGEVGRSEGKVEAG